MKGSKSIYLLCTSNKVIIGIYKDIFLACKKAVELNSDHTDSALHFFVHIVN